MAKPMFVLAVLTAPVWLFPLNWTVENIDSYRVDKPTISVDDSGHAFIFGNAAGGNDIIGYIQNTSGTWQRDSLLFSRETNINYNCRVSSARGSTGTHHALYRVAGGTYGWPVYTNNAGGTFTTADTLVKNSSQSTFHYGIAVDNLDRAHIICEIYYGGSRITYFYPFTDTAILIADNAMDGTITVDKNNIVHVAYCYPTSNSRIYYTNNSSGSFSAPQLVSDTIGMDPSIAIDTLGFAHVTWTRSNWDTTSELFYATNQTGVFMTTKITMTPGLCEAWPHIALSPDNTIGIVYSRYHPSPYGTDILFAYKQASESVFYIDSISQGHWNPSYGATSWNDKAIAIDELGYVHLAYAGASGTEYVKSQAPVGTVETFVAEEKSVLELTLRPNPFHDNLKIRFQTPIRRSPYGVANQTNPKSQTTLKIYDVTGRVVNVLRPSSSALRPAQITWNGTDKAGGRLPAGVYLLQATVDYEGKRYTVTEKVILTE